MTGSSLTTPPQRSPGRTAHERRNSGATRVEQLAGFVRAARFEQISEAACAQLKARVLDALGCAFGGLDGDPPRMIAAHWRRFGGAPLATLIGGGRSAPQHDYEGFTTRPMGWNAIAAKFDRLAEPHIDAQRRARIIEAVSDLDQLTLQPLTRLLAIPPTRR